NLRPRNRPSPIARPIGSPMTLAAAVAMAATWSVNQMTLNSVGFPWMIRGTAALISSQIRCMSCPPEAESEPARRLLQEGEGAEQRQDQPEEDETRGDLLGIAAVVLDLGEQCASEGLVLADRVGADDHDGTHLRDGGPERGDHRGDDADP